jgi:ectoine hydroxylase-related dioxygenase (phytanoyl-CoA dioxygenase family)
MTQKHAPSELNSRFFTDGYVFPIDVLDDDEVTAILRAIHPNGKKLNPFTRIKPHLLLPELWDLIRHPRLLAPIKKLLGEDIVCIGSSTIEKAPDTDGFVAWHQDATFWGMDSPIGATAWLALTPSTRVSGCVQVLPRTHSTQMPHHAPNDPNNMLGAREEVKTLPPLDGAVAMELQPGQMSLHHPLVLHGSDPNKADHDRVGFAIRYFSADAYQAGGSVTLVSGQNRSNMDLEEFSGLSHAGLALHAERARKFAAVIRREKTAHLRASGKEM